MSERDDRKLGMNRNITRRDFLNGVAVGTGGAMAGSVLPDFAWQALAPSSEPQDQPGYYPPALTACAEATPAHSRRRTVFVTASSRQKVHRPTTQKRPTIWSSLAVASAASPQRISGVPKTPTPAF